MNKHSLLSVLSAAAFALSLGACSPQAPNDEIATATPSPTEEPTATPEPTPAPVAAKPEATAKPRPKPVAERPAPTPQICQECGTVASITPVKQKGAGSGAGAAVGAVAGGVAGHQVGGGRGKDVATVAGAVLGALAGNEIEKRARATETYDVLISMDNGSQRQINVTSLDGLSVGTPVRVQGDTISFR